MDNCECSNKKTYVEAIKEINECIEDYGEEGYTGLGKVMAVLEYAQWIEKIDYASAKEILYRFVENMFHPEWD